MRHRLGAFGGEDVDLALRRQQTRLAVLELGDFFAQSRVGLLGALDGARAGLHQAVVADLFFLRELQIGFGSSDVGRALLDDRLLQSNLRFEIAHCGFRCGDIGMRLIERRLEIAIVDPGQQLAGLDRLVVADQHLRDVAGDFWRDDRGVGLHIGIIGRFQIPAGSEIVVAKVRHGGDSERQSQREGRALDRPLRGAKANFRFDIRDIRSGRHGILTKRESVLLKRAPGTPEDAISSAV